MLAEPPARARVSEPLLTASPHSARRGGASEREGGSAQEEEAGGGVAAVRGASMLWLAWGRRGEGAGEGGAVAGACMNGRARVPGSHWGTDGGGSEQRTESRPPLQMRCANVLPAPLFRPAMLRSTAKDGHQ